MKRISTLLLSAAMIFGSVSVAQAIDIKAKGQWDFAFGWADNMGARDKNHGNRTDPFQAKHRVRTQVNFIASEQLQGVVMFEIGNLDWGRDNGKNGRSSGGGLDADGVNVETKRAYLDWMIPETDVSVRMGIQGLALPSATGFGNPVFQNDVAGITVSTKFNDMFGLAAFWARPFDKRASDPENTNHNSADETDLFGLLVPITGDGWGLTPWGVVGVIGSDSGFYDYVFGNRDGLFSTDNPNFRPQGSTMAWWLGSAFELTMFDPLTFKMDVMYGKLDDVRLFRGTRDYSADGWFVDAALDYKIEGFATAGLFGWWSTGDDASDYRKNELGRMPVLGMDDGFGPTSFGFAGGPGISAESAIHNTGVGTWGLGVQLADMSFIDSLSHTLRFAWYQGTNSYRIIRNNNFNQDEILGYGDRVYMTNRDNAYEVNFNTKYQIYENLATFLELAYINLDLKDRHWGPNSSKNTDDAWKAQVLFQYKF